MDAVRRHEAPGAETRDFNTHAQQPPWASCVHRFLSAPQSHGGWHRGSPMGVAHAESSCCSWGTLRLGKSPSRQAAHLPVLRPCRLRVKTTSARETWPYLARFPDANAALRKDPDNEQSEPHVQKDVEKREQSVEEFLSKQSSNTTQDDGNEFKRIDNRNKGKSMKRAFFRDRISKLGSGNKLINLSSPQLSHL